MPVNDQTLTFIMVSFCLAIVLILMRDRIPTPINKYLAMFAALMVVMSFVMIVLTFLQAI
jgi:hypothetical protein